MNTMTQTHEFWNRAFEGNENVPASLNRKQAIKNAKDNPDRCFNFDTGDGLYAQVMFCSWRKRCVFTTHTKNGIQIV